VIEVAIETPPGTPGVGRGIEPAPTGGDVLFGAADEYMVNVVVQAIAPFAPGLPTVFADVDAADLHARDDAIRRVGVDPEAANVCLVTVSGGVPLLARGEVLKALQFLPTLAVVARAIEVSGMGAGEEALTTGTCNDREDLLPWNAEALPGASIVRRSD
jgi:hypothetical protein